MKLLHISDLHLGRRLNGMSFLPQQKQQLQQILQLITAQEIQAVLIAGDVYDKSVPPIEAVTLFDTFLTGLAERQAAVFLISGNHDSPERIQFGSRLLEPSRIHIAGTFQGTIPCISLKDEYGPIHVYLLPFFKLSVAAQYYPDETFSDLSALLRRMLQDVALRKEERNLLLYHGFVLSGQQPPEESESEMQLGGMQLVDASVFMDFDYVALGHIHKPQWVKKERIRYSGSLLKYSFSEARQEKSVTILTLGKKGSVEVCLQSLPVVQDMRILRGPLEELLACAVPSEDWMQVELTDETMVPYALERLRTVYPNVMELRYIWQAERTASHTTVAEAVPQRTLMELVEAFYQEVYHYELRGHEEERMILQQICQEVEQKQ